MASGSSGQGRPGGLPAHGSSRLALGERLEDPHPIVDDPACVMEVRLGKVSHRVVVSGQLLAGDQAEVEPFRRVWHGVQALVPEPEW